MEFPLPIKGVAYGLPVDKVSVATSGYMNNCRPVDTLEKRLRIGQRPGLDKWGNGDQIGAAEQPVVAMCVVSSVT